MDWRMSATHTLNRPQCRVPYVRFHPLNLHRAALVGAADLGGLLTVAGDDADALIEFGRDFDEALAECHRVARERDMHFMPPFNRGQVKGVATYALELFRSVADLHTVYVPIGMGSGISGVITARDLLCLKAEVVGVVACNGVVIRGRQACSDKLCANLCRWTSHARSAGRGADDHQARRGARPTAQRRRYHPSGALLFRGYAQYC